MKGEPTILLASHNFFVECSWKYLTEKDDFNYSLIDIAKSQNELEKKVVNLHPDIIVVDHESSSFNLKKSIAFIDITSPNSKIIFTGKLKKKVFYDEYSHLNVLGFITNALGKNELQECLSYILKGEFFFSKEVTELKEQEENKSQNTLINQLNISERELEIIKLIAEGLINKEIADRLFISTHTVNTHRKNIMQKLGINNTSGIVLFAVKEGLVSPNDFLFSSR